MKVKPIVDRIKQLIFTEAFKPRTLKALGITAVRTIQKRTRRGLGVTKRSGGSVVKLDGHTAKYKKQRVSLKRRGKLSKKTSPPTSNFTKSGSAVDNIGFEVERNGVNIKMDEPDKIKDNEYRKRHKSTFFGISKKEEKLLADVIADRIVNALKKI